jgi:hypothetical protein
LITLTGLEFLTAFGSVSISLVTVALTSAYLFLSNLKISKDFISFVLAGILTLMLFTGLYNLIFSEMFSFISHFKLIVKVAIVFFMAITFPIILSKISPVQLSSALIFAIRVHALMLIFDGFFYSPIDFNEGGVILNERSIDYYRPRGLFAEPSFFAVLQGTLLCTVLFLSNRFDDVKVKSHDFFIGIASMIISTSIFGSTIAIIIAFQYLFMTLTKQNIRNVKNIFIGIITILFICVISFIYFNDEVQYVQERLTHLIFLKDGSSNGRIFGSFASIIDVLENKPFSGYGGGAVNQVNNINSSTLFFTDGFHFNIYKSNVIFWSGIAITSGLITMLLFFSLFIYIFCKKYYFYLLVMFLMTFSGGGYYSIIFWFSVVIFCYYRKIKNISINPI